MGLTPPTDANISQLVTTPKDNVCAHTLRHFHISWSRWFQVMPNHNIQSHVCLGRPCGSLLYVSLSNKVVPLYYPPCMISAHFIPSSPITLVIFGVRTNWEDSNYAVFFVPLLRPPSWVHIQNTHLRINKYLLRNRNRYKYVWQLFK
jgi:hypothetical protein